MNIIYKLTLRFLKSNKKRTIFTILSIALSVTLINAVGISLASIKEYYKDTIVYSTGSYHYQIVTNNKKMFDIIENDKKIKDYYYTNTNTYTDYKYNLGVELKKGDELYFDKRNVENLLVEGSLPSNDKEIVIDQYYKKDYGYKIGDVITLTKEDGKEDFEYTIVGFMNPSDGNWRDRYFNAISYVNLSNGEWYTISIEDKDESKSIFLHSRELEYQYEMITGGSDLSLRYNTSYLGVQGIFEEGSHSSFLVAYGLVGVIMSIVVVASVFIIYQAFNLSTHDKIEYLGMLSSVGATPQQKRNSVFYEGFILTGIALPIGILCSFIGMHVTFSYINTLNIIKETNAIIPTIIDFDTLIMTIILTIVTITLALVKPAIHLSRISVIDALKKADEIVVKKRKLRLNLISRKLLNFNWQLALKNYKRQGKRTSVIVFSLVLSMVLFISIFSFSKQLYDTMVNDTAYGLYDITVWTHEEEERNILNEYLKNNQDVDGYYMLFSDTSYKLTLNDDYFSSDYNGLMDIKLTTHVVDDETFKKICKVNKIAYLDNSHALIMGVAVNNAGAYSYHHFKDIKADFIEKIVLGNGKKETYVKPFDRLTYISEDPYRIIKGYADSVEIIISESYYKQYYQDANNTLSHHIKTDEHTKMANDLTTLELSFYNYTESNQSEYEMILVMQIFIYGFICLMILFALLNIMNMMSASVDKRKKEFAMLLSVGMSHRDIKKMIFKECLVYGIKTFIYAFPVCIFVEWLMFRQVSSQLMPFTVSYDAYMISFIVIMGVMLFTFKTALNKLHKQNIIESLKEA